MSVYQNLTNVHDGRRVIINPAHVMYWVTPVTGDKTGTLLHFATGSAMHVMESLDDIFMPTVKAAS